MLILTFLFLAAGSGYGATNAAPASRDVPLIVTIPGARDIETSQPLIIQAPTKLITLPAPIIHKPPPLIIKPARTLSADEAAAAKLPSEPELAKLVADLTQTDSPRDEDGALGASRVFDGADPRATSSPLETSYFMGGPLAPRLGEVESASREIISHFFPRLYRPLPVRAVYAEDMSAAASHSWTPAGGHLIEMPSRAPDSRGEVASDVGLPGAARVQQKIDHLILFSHEFTHALFDDAVGKSENHAPLSAYSALTEGFALVLEQALVESMLGRPEQLRLSSRDALDLSALSRARRQWLAATDTHYSEGIQPWRAAFERGGQAAVRELHSSLSARRMTHVMRFDPVYQLALGDPALLSAYLGKNPEAPLRQGLDAYGAAARGDALSEAEALAAKEAIEAAGPSAWRRLFERTLLKDKNLAPPEPPDPSKPWCDNKKTVRPASVEPAFAAARLSPSAADALARFLLETISLPGGALRLFEQHGPGPKLKAVVAGADTLPWEEAARRAWLEALTRWLSLS